MNGFTSLEEIGEQFNNAAKIEVESLFVQGRIVKRAIEQGFDIDETTGYCASLVMKTKRTVYRYYTVARTFNGQMLELPFEHHAIAADTIDYRKNMTADELETAQNNALKWLYLAKEQGWSTRALRDAISAAVGRVELKPEVLLDGVGAVFVGVGAADRNISEMRSLYLRIPIDSYEQLVNLENETAVKLTLVKALSVEALGQFAPAKEA